MARTDPRRPHLDAVESRRTGKIADALIVAMRHGHRRGRERAWVLDQIVRSLTGTHYHEWVASFEVSDRKWDEGTEPQ
jgi:hypothetical protein